MIESELKLAQMTKKPGEPQQNDRIWTVGNKWLLKRLKESTLDLALSIWTSTRS